MSTCGYADQLNSPANYGIAAIAAAGSFLFGLLVTPGLFLEIPFNKDHKGINIIAREGSLNVHWSVILAHLVVLGIAMFVLILLVNPALTATC